MLASELHYLSNNRQRTTRQLLWPRSGTKGISSERINAVGRGDFVPPQLICLFCAEKPSNFSSWFPHYLPQQVNSRSPTPCMTPTIKSFSKYCTRVQSFLCPSERRLPKVSPRSPTNKCCSLCTVYLCAQFSNCFRPSIHYIHARACVRALHFSSCGLLKRPLVRFFKRADAWGP